MTRLLGAALTTAFVFAISGAARADDADAKPIIDKAIKALGGEEKLNKVESFSWKSKGTINFNGNENETNGLFTAKGLTHYRRESSNDQFHIVVVLAGDKGWRKFGDDPMELDESGMANEKRNLYLQVIPITLVAVKGNGFKCAVAGEEKVADKPAAGVKITAPDGKDFTLYFDKESGLPVKMVATVAGFQGQDYTQETLFSDYKDFGGIKKATKTVVKRDGETFITQELTEFKVLDKVEPDTFTEPK
jgi:outer membrane lipoprotein-sorting protein